VSGECRQRYYGEESLVQGEILGVREEGVKSLETTSVTAVMLQESCQLCCLCHPIVT